MLVVVVGRKQLKSDEQAFGVQPVVRSPLAVGERRMMISHRVRENEIAVCLSGINSSNSYSTGNLWSRRVDSKVHELDGSPHGVVILLIRREQTEKRLSCSKDSEEEKVWRAFTALDLPGKSVWVEWDKSPSLGENMI